MGNADPNNTKAGNKYEVKPQYEELSKQINMQHAINQCYECMRLSKEISQLDRCNNRQIISCRLYTTVYQPGNHRSVIIGARQPITAWRERQEKVEDVTRQIGEMELVLARFQRTNPHTFTGTDGGILAEGWLEHMEDLFDTLEYTAERILKLAILKLREHAQHWWKGTSRVMRDTVVLVSWDSFCAAFQHDYTPESYFNTERGSSTT
ncbi:hypothetical protein F511_22539 [Dorcoceras hygrometricum]|uniref:Retrotransposon gag domain-containing protein n=1 Tax=Dorcoceras hygrometricum TaxID=472368 RepID=A0A2Z7C1E5_9LAMI|nr:hypothetical protein F511_22539 [Dorcoceras hygrometricum]